MPEPIGDEDKVMAHFREACDPLSRRYGNYLVIASVNGRLLYRYSESVWSEGAMKSVLRSLDEQDRIAMRLRAEPDED